MKYGNLNICKICGKKKGFRAGGRITHAKCSKVLQEIARSKPDKKIKSISPKKLENLAIVMRAYE